jgi:hypothetical protein
VNATTFSHCAAWLPKRSADDWLAAKPAPPQFSGWWFERFSPGNIKALFKEDAATSMQ